MDNSITDLIKLETIGSISEEEFSELIKAMQKSKSFPWRELGEYQNLAALLSLVVKKETPNQDLKEKLFSELRNIEKVSSGDAELRDEEKFLNDIKSFDGIDLDEKGETKGLKLIDHSNEFEEVKSKILKIRDRIKESESTEPQKIKNLHKPEEFVKRTKAEKKKRLPKAVIIGLGAIVIAITASVLVYFNFFISDIDEQKRLAEKETEQLISKSRVDPPIETEIVLPVENSETLQPEEILTGETESLLEEKSEPEIQPEIVEEEKVLENPVIPPPESPSFIDAPLEKEMEKTNEESTENVKKQLLDSKMPPKEESIIETEPVYFVAVEEMPEPIGGIRDIQKMIVYPEIAKRAGVEGKVLVLAYVDESGNVTKAEVIKGIGLGCDEAAVNAVLQTKFKPGKQRGKSVKVKVTIPITFKL